MNRYKEFTEYKYNTLRFCDVYGTFDAFKENVVDSLVFVKEPIMGWETLYTLIFRQHSANEFKSNTFDFVNADMISFLDTHLTKYSNYWNITFSDYIESLEPNQIVKDNLIQLRESPQDLNEDLTLKTNFLTREQLIENENIYSKLSGFANTFVPSNINQFFNELQNQLFISIKIGGFHNERQ